LGKWKILLFVFAGLVVGLVLGLVFFNWQSNHVAGDTTAPQLPPVVAKPAPEFELPVLGEQISKKFAGKLVVLGVNSAEDDKLVEGYVKELGINFPILLDRKGSVTDLYFVRDFPITFFVDAQGTIRSQRLGTLNQDRIGQYLETIGIQP
jgi:hypothetical protein